MQNDIHSPQTTVEEALIFSASLRLLRENDAAVVKSFVKEIMQIVELTPLGGALVGLPGAPPPPLLDCFLWPLPHRSWPQRTQVLCCISAPPRCTLVAG